MITGTREDWRITSSAPAKAVNLRQRHVQKHKVDPILFLFKQVDGFHSIGKLRAPDSLLSAR